MNFSQQTKPQPERAKPLRLVQSTPRDFYARDCYKLINAACGILEKEYARSVDALMDLINLSKYKVVRRPLPGRQRSGIHKATRTITICSRLEFKLSSPTSLDDTIAFCLAKEVAHIRLHLSQVKELLPKHHEEAETYASVLLGLK